MRILIVEDDSRLLTQLDALLRTNGYSVDLADDGAKALFLLSEHPYDLAIIDIGLPVMDGFDVIQKARKSNVACPILILTARDRWQEKVEGLDAGADDYLTKPFQNEELLARVKALIRRSAGQASPTIELGPVSLNTLKTELTEHIYDQDFDLDSNVIEVFVGRLRKKLDPEGLINPIETMRGRGYRISREFQV